MKEIFAMIDFALAAFNIGHAVYSFSNGGLAWLNAGAAVFCFGCGLVVLLGCER